MTNVQVSKSFLEILSSGEHRKCWFLETQDSRQVLFWFCLITQRSLSLPDLSRKIKRPLLARYKLINNNFFKDRSFQGCLVLEIRCFGYFDQSLRAKKGKGKKRAREKDRNRFAKEGPNFGFCECVKNV